MATLREALAECRRERQAEPDGLWDGETVVAYRPDSDVRTTQVVFCAEQRYLDMSSGGEPYRFYHAKTPDMATLTRAEQILREWDVPSDDGWLTPAQLVAHHAATLAADPVYQQLLTALRAAKALGYSREKVIGAWDNLTA